MRSFSRSSDTRGATTRSHGIRPPEASSSGVIWFFFLSLGAGITVAALNINYEFKKSFIIECRKSGFLSKNIVCSLDCVVWARRTAGTLPPFPTIYVSSQNVAEFYAVEKQPTEIGSKCNNVPTREVFNGFHLQRMKAC
jgi:hypothetical protein